MNLNHASEGTSPHFRLLNAVHTKLEDSRNQGHRLTVYQPIVNLGEHKCQLVDIGCHQHGIDVVHVATVVGKHVSKPIEAVLDGQEQYRSGQLQCRSFVGSQAR
jgi:hypothetical protein